MPAPPQRAGSPGQTGGQPVGSSYQRVDPERPVLRTGGVRPLARRSLACGVADAPLVSVILPTRDRPERLRIALASVLAQTYPAIEAIVVNDGGVDVRDLIRSLDAGERVVGLHLPRSRERSAARNCGLRVARGKYVAYLDDDDWYDPGHVATLVEALERENAAVAYTCARRVTEELRDGRWTPVGVDVPFRRFFDATVLLMGNYIPIPTLAHRRDCLDAIGLFDENLTALEDWELAIRLSRRWPFVAIPTLTCNFTWREPRGEAARHRLLDFVRSTEIIYRRYAAEAAMHPEVAQVHAEFFRKMRAVRGPELYTASVIVPASPGDPTLPARLETLAGACRGVDHEIIVVDAPRGYAAAWNEGAASAHGGHLAFVAPDVTPDQGWLAKAMAQLDDDLRALAVRGGDRTEQPALLVRRAAFRAIGGFDEGCPSGHETAELCARLGVEPLTA